MQTLIIRSELILHDSMTYSTHHSGISTDTLHQFIIISKGTDKPILLPLHVLTFPLNYALNQSANKVKLTYLCI